MKFIGYQIATPGYDEFPDEFASFEVLTMAAVQRFFDKTPKEDVRLSEWVVHPVYENTIAEYTMVD